MCTTLSKRNILFILISLLFAGFLGISLVSAAATNCGSYKPGTPPPPGYGAAYNVFSPSQLLLKVTCDTGSVTVEAGRAGDSSQAVYEKGYHYRDGSWKSITLTGSKRLAAGSPWYLGSAEVAIPSSQLVSGANYVVAYTCTDEDDQWKCGCSDTSCTQGKWMLQVFNKSGAGVGSGMSFACGVESKRKPGEVIKLPDARVGQEYCAGLPGQYLLDGDTCQDFASVEIVDPVDGWLGSLGIGVKHAGAYPDKKFYLKNLAGEPRESGTIKFKLSFVDNITRDVRSMNPCDPEGVNPTLDVLWTQDYEITILPADCSGSVNRPNWCGCSVSSECKSNKCSPYEGKNRCLPEDYRTH